jgi:hypothetical protein
MFSGDKYTKVVLSIIAVCLVVLCFEQAHWNTLQTVQAQQPTLINGYSFDDSGTTKQFLFGNGNGEKLGLPVVVVRKQGNPNGDIKPASQ